MENYFSSSAALVLKPFRKSAAEVMSELASNPVELIQEITTDPVGYIAGKISPNRPMLANATISSANRFLFAMLANDSFRDWLGQYHDSLTKAIESDPFYQFDNQIIQKDFAAALTKYADQPLIEALLESAKPIGAESMSIDKTQLTIPIDSTVVYAAVVGPVAIAVAAAIAAVAFLVVVAGAPVSFASNALEAYSYSGQELASLADALTAKAKELRKAGKI